MCFIPFVNPDGYLLNEETCFNTGNFGYRRKNARDNDRNGRIDNFDGVDLNRNCGYMWGYDDIGSSPCPESGTYSGLSPCSEPETSAIRELTRNHSFLLALNYHSYSNLRIYPWGYNDSETLDSLYFRRLADDLTVVNNYQYGTGMETVGYRVNGDSDDWMYGEQSEKPAIFSMTPEIGGHFDGFYPAPDRIIALSQDNLEASLSLARVAGASLLVGSEVSTSDSAGTGNGFADPGETVDLTVSADNRGLSQSLYQTSAELGCDDRLIDIIKPGSTFGTIDHQDNGDNGADSFQVTVSDSITNGESIWFFVDFTADGGYVSRDSFDVIVGTPEIIFSDDAENGTGSFDLSGWGTDPRYASSGRSPLPTVPGQTIPPTA